jgi:hypothetical protein
MPTTDKDGDAQVFASADFVWTGVNLELVKLLTGSGPE